MTVWFALLWPFLSVHGLRGLWQKRLEVLMPGAQPIKNDTYLCTTVRVPYGTVFIKKIEPVTDIGSGIHHRLLLGSRYPQLLPAPGQVWSCANNYTFERGVSLFYILGRYTSAKRATFKLPRKYGFKVGTNSKRKSLVLQIHYLHPLDRPDTSGVVLTLERDEMTKPADLIFLRNSGSIPAMKTINLDITCSIRSRNPLRLFAYMVHTHALGRVVSGYRVRNSTTLWTRSNYTRRSWMNSQTNKQLRTSLNKTEVWTAIAKGTPEPPQMFHHLKKSKQLILHNNDYLAARCVMQSNRTWLTLNGLRAEDEMCHYFLMYIQVGSSERRVSFDGDCWANRSVRWDKMFKKPPERQANIINGKYYPPTGLPVVDCKKGACAERNVATDTISAVVEVLRNI